MNENCYKEDDVLLLGAGGHAKVIIDTILTYYKNLHIIGITDKAGFDNGQGTFNIPIIGTDSVLQELYNKGLRKAIVSVGTTGYYQRRLDLFNIVKSIGYCCINVLHGKSIVSDYIKIGEGNVVLAGAIINTDAEIGNNCIINTGSIIEHDCRIGDNVHLAPGTKVCGNTSIGNNCMVGAGATIIHGVHIGDNCIIGAGSVVLKNVESNSILAGIPAKIIKKR